MRAGFKVAAAGLAIVLGCGAVALSPIEWPFPLEANPMLATASSEAAMAETPLSPEEIVPTYDYGYTDGTYRGHGQGKFGSVPVKVVIERGAIASITVGSNNEAGAMLQKAQEKVIPQILDRQTVVGIDVATGATATSNAIIEAVGDVLARARG